MRGRTGSAEALVRSETLVPEDLPLDGTLEDLLDRDGPVPVERAVGFTLELLAALDGAHRSGIVHRDVQPRNVALRDGGRTTLIDWGSAGRASQPRPFATLSVYAAPEQGLGGPIGPATDVYGAAATLFALITGDNPVDLFAAGPGSSRWASVPAALRPVLVRATRHRPEQRHRSAAELARELRAAATRLGLSTVEVDPRPAPPAPRRPWGTVALGLALAAAVAGVGWLLTSP